MGSLFQPLLALRPGQILAEYSEWIYFALVVFFFISVAGLALRKHFERPYVRPLIIVVGLAMAFAVFRNRRILALIFEGWGTLGSILLVCLTAAIPFNLARGFGMGKSRAFWLTYILLYLISWAHLPEFYQALADRGLGLVNVVLLLLFIFAVFKLFSSGGRGNWGAWAAQEKEDKANLEQETRQDLAEEKELEQAAAPLTFKEIKSVEDMEAVLRDLEDHLHAAGSGRSRQSHADLIRQVQALSGKEQIFKINLARLDKIFKRLGVADEQQLKEKRTRLKKAKGEERKILKAELQRQEEIVLIERTVRELERRMAANLKAFDKALAETVRVLRQSPYMRDAAPLVFKAGRELKNVRAIVLSLKDLEERMVHIVKFERNLLGKEKKAA